MVIRPANASDLQACLEIDDSFETESVWQMEERVASNRISVGFRLARLPRPMRVRGIASREGLAESFKKKPSAFFVADDGVVRGYIQAVASRALEVLHVQRVVVAPALRRQGIGTQLLRAAVTVARQQQLRALVLDVNTKAHPTIAFFQKNGFAFCGFNDQLYPNHDIALYFAMPVK